MSKDINQILLLLIQYGRLFFININQYLSFVSEYAILRNSVAKVRRCLASQKRKSTPFITMPLQHPRNRFATKDHQRRTLKRTVLTIMILTSSNVNFVGYIMFEDKRKANSKVSVVKQVGIRQTQPESSRVTF